MLLNDDESILIDFLALIYCRIPWVKMRTRHNPHDIFNHRVRAAARRATLYQFSSKLCNYFGLQTLPIDAQKLLDKIRPIENDVLNTLSSEHIPICVRAIIKAHEIKEKAKGEKDGISEEI